MSARALAFAAIGLLSAGTAQAAVVSFTPNVTLASTPLTINLGGALYSFTSVDTGSGIGAAVATASTAQVSSFFGGIADFGAGSTIDGTGLFGFSAFPAAATIPYSVADDFIGLAYLRPDGVHYGYAEVNGPTLVSYAVESSPGTAIQTGAQAAAVPEPATMAVLAAGLAGLAAGGRRRVRPASRAA